MRWKSHVLGCPSIIPILLIKHNLKVNLYLLKWLIKLTEYFSWPCRKVFTKCYVSSIHFEF